MYKKKEQCVPQTIFISALVGINWSKQKAKNKILLTLGVSETAFWSKEKVWLFDFSFLIFFFNERDHQEKHLNILPLELPVVLPWFILHTSILESKTQFSSESPSELGKECQPCWLQSCRAQSRPPQPSAPFSVCKGKPRDLKKEGLC